MLPCVRGSLQEYGREDRWPFRPSCRIQPIATMGRCRLACEAAFDPAVAPVPRTRRRLHRRHLLSPLLRPPKVEVDGGSVRAIECFLRIVLRAGGALESVGGARVG